MAREKDEGKRKAILDAAKRLFAERGFHATSVSDLAGATELPVGSIYTYFENKDAVIRTVIEEGWEEFIEGLASALGRAASPEEKLGIVLDRFLPALFEDMDLISLILAESGRVSGLEEKLERLAGLMGGIIADLGEARGRVVDFPPRQARTAITLFLLGSIDTVRLAREAGLSVSPEDVLQFIRTAVKNSFGVELAAPAPAERA